MVAGDEAGAVVRVVEVVEVVVGGEDFEVEDVAEEGLEAMGEILYLRKVSRTLLVSAVKFKYSWRACQQGPRSRNWFSISQQSGRSRWTDSVGSPGFTSTRIKRPARPRGRQPSPTWTTRPSWWPCRLTTSRVTTEIQYKSVPA